MDCKKVFFDINVVLDLLDSKRPKSTMAKVVLEELILSDSIIMISEDMLSTIFYIHKEKKEVLAFLKIIQDDWAIAPFGKEVIKNAIDLSIKQNLDLEDVLQCLCAKENNCDALITNDKHFHDCGLSIFTIEEFIEKRIE